MSPLEGPGPVALVGSGEFLQVMAPIDAELLEGRPRRAVFLPTAAGEEGPERVRYWVELGTTHYRAMGVEPVALEVLDRKDAGRPELAAKLAGAGLIYLSGGNPGYLAHTLAGTPVWEAILEAWHAGAALAGCSAGACALSRIADDFARPGHYSGAGLAVVPQLVVLPHFDRLERWRPGLTETMAGRTPKDAVLVGIDEETALVGHGESFIVRGKRSAWRIDRDGTRWQFKAGELFNPSSGAPPAAGLPRRAAQPYADPERNHGQQADRSQDHPLGR